MKDIAREALLMKPCNICVMLGEKRCTRPSEDSFSCGIYAEIVCAQWNATCKLIRAHTDKK